MSRTVTAGWVVVTAALGLGACGTGGSTDADACLEMVLERTGEIQEAYRNGRLTGPAKQFLDENGENLAMIPAEFEIAEENPEQCGWLLDDVPGADKP